MHLNIRSLLAKGKFNTLRAQMTNSKCHVITLSETWLNGKIPSSMVDIEGYTLHRQDRVNRTKVRGGGLVVYISKDINVDDHKFSRINSCNKDIEIQCVLLDIPHVRQIIIFNIYRPPQGNFKTFSTYLLDAITTAYSLGNTNAEMYLMGDFNIDFLDNKNQHSKELVQLMKAHGFSHLIKVFTRHGNNPTGIDQIFTNSNTISQSGVLDFNLSDHLAIYCSRKKTKNFSPKIEFEGRSYRHYIKEDFQDNLINSNWRDFYSSRDPEICWNIMEGIITREISKMCPLKTFKVFESKDPWITNEILEEIRDKDLAINRARKSGKPEDWGLARSERNRVGKMVDSARANFFEEEERNSRDDPKRFWRNISSAVPSKKTNNHNISLSNPNNNSDVKGECIPQFINKFFTTIGPNLAKDFKEDKWVYSGEVNSDTDIIDVHTDYEEVYNLCKEINVSKSSAIKNLSSKIIKDAFLVLVLQLVYLFNLSLEVKVFPYQWKTATVIPLFKGGNRRDVGNYRPISLLPLPGKILEKIVHNKLALFLDANKLLCEEQCGFRKGRSTLHSIVNLTDSLLSSINNRETCMAVFIDLTKAFDTINHSILIKKLEYLGIKGNLLLWITNYLHDRTQKTFANGSLSEALPITCGVPQGSILGPLFFIAYINDIKHFLNDSEFGLYADDTVLFSHAKDKIVLQNKLQAKLDLFCEWSRMNALTINILKTKYMIFGTRAKLKKAKDIVLSVGGQTLHQVPSFRYLGVTLDSVLSYSNHISTVLNSVSHKAYILSKIRRFITTYSAVKIYKSMLLPYFDYADIVFDKANQNNLDKLQRMQNRCLKICLRSDIRTDTDLIHSTVKTAKLEYRRKAHLRSFMYSKLGDESLIDDLPINTRSRDAPLFKVSTPNLEVFKKSVKYNGAVEWNNLPIDLRSANHILSFKYQQKKWLNSTF